MEERKTSRVNEPASMRQIIFEILVHNPRTSSLRKSVERSTKKSKNRTPNRQPHNLPYFFIQKEKNS